MPAPYRDLLKRLRLAFPRPVSDKIHDSYFVHSILRALDHVDDLKSEIPLLGRPTVPDYEKARQAALRLQASLDSPPGRGIRYGPVNSSTKPRP